MAKTFSKFGLKRSLNLGDIPDRKAALNNILDNLRGARESFTWEDIELLRDISLTEITTGTFTSASNATVKSITSNGTLQIYEPLITLENRFDTPNEVTNAQRRRVIQWIMNFFNLTEEDLK